MDNMGNNNEFANSFPISDDEKFDIAEQDTQEEKHLSVLNIGQILVLAILCTVICLQAIELFSYQRQSRGAAVEQLQYDANYRQPGFYEVAEPINSVNSAEYTRTGELDYYITDSTDINGIDYTTNELLEAIPPDPEVIFILGESNGRLAILSADGQTVYETFNVHINTLPPLDRDMLRSGIRITTTEELSSLLEDFSS